MKKNSKIYIAGHAGMVGSAVTAKFREAGYINLILRTRQELDLLNQSAVTDFFEHESPEFVILAAARVGGIKANMDYAADFIYENLQIQNNVIWQAHLAGVKKLLFLGSSCVYPRQAPQPIKEEYFFDGKPEPTNEGYALAKIAGLKLCEKIYGQFNQAFVSCMPTNIYGENDNFDDQNAHVIPALIGRFHRAKQSGESEVVIWGTGKARREFMHVRDLANAVLWLMQNYKEKQFLNIGVGVDVSIKDLALLIKKMVGYEEDVFFDSSKPDGMPRKLLDVSRINALGWKAKISLEDGLNETYEWYKNNIDSK
ncbi:MAG: GDP-L-fucose synthase [Parcubacteria group bacterium]